MKIPYYKALLAICLATIMSVHVYAQNKEAGFPLAPYFSPGTTDVMYPDDEGFIRRWLLLEPIDKPNRSNTVFTDSYIREAFATEYFPKQFTVLPKDGDKVKVGKQKLNYFVLHPIFKSRYTAYCFGQLQLSIVRKTYQTSGFQ